MKKDITLITMLLLLAVSFVSCGKDDEPEVKVPFTVVSTNPPQGATGVPLNTIVKIVFSKKIAFDPACFRDAGPDNRLSVSYDNDKTVSITFARQNGYLGNDFAMAIDGLKSSDGENLKFDKIFGEGQSQYYLLFTTAR